MAYNFISCNRDQAYLLPPSLEDWLAEDHLAWFVLDAVEQIDLSAFFKKYRTDGVGNSAFHPKMMVALLLYSYCTGQRSSRQIEMHCLTDIAYRVITANTAPDHSTISRFRQTNQGHLKALFLEILRLCVEAGMVKLGTMALDGTKIKANASLSANRTLEHLEKEIEKMLAEASTKDAEEDQQFGSGKRGDELPQELQSRQSRKDRLRVCKERLEQEKAQAHQTQQEQIDHRAEKEERTGKKSRGRKPKTPEQVEKDKAKANVTDPDSRIMKTRSGFVQGLNGQAVVTENQIIVAEDVTRQQNDVKQLHPMLEQVEANRQAVGIEEPAGVLLADAGYCSEANLIQETAGGVMLLVATLKDYKQRKALQDQPIDPDLPVPDGLSATERMERTLRTERGRALYKLRGQTVEPVFGQMKQAMGDRFMRRGLEACQSEWSLMCATHNLRKLHRSGKARWN